MIKIEDYWTNKNHGDPKSEKINQTIPEGVKKLFNIYFHAQPKTEEKDIFNASKAEFDIDTETIANEARIQDIVGHTILGLALAKSADQMAPMELILHEDINFERDKTALNDIISNIINNLLKNYKKDISKRELVEYVRGVVTDEYFKLEVRPLFLKDLISTIDDEDWYKMGMTVVQIYTQYNQKLELLKSNVREEMKATKVQITEGTVRTVKQIVDAKIKPKKIILDKELREALYPVFEDIMDQYRPIIRANKILELRRYIILLEWFDNNFDTIEGDHLPQIDQITTLKLDQLTKSFSDNIELFITSTNAEITELESKKYLFLSRSVYKKFGKLLKKYLVTTEAKKALSKGLEHSIARETDEDISAIVEQYLRMFDILK
jgi:hypothetical protein